MALIPSGAVNYLATSDSLDLSLRDSVVAPRQPNRGKLTMIDPAPYRRDVNSEELSQFLGFQVALL